jgi:hypothetical protein
VTVTPENQKWIEETDNVVIAYHKSCGWDASAWVEDLQMVAGPIGKWWTIDEAVGALRHQVLSMRCPLPPVPKENQ